MPNDLRVIDEAREMLGIWIAPDGNNVCAVRELTVKVKRWIEKVRTGHLRGVTFGFL